MLFIGFLLVIGLIRAAQQPDPPARFDSSLSSEQIEHLGTTIDGFYSGMPAQNCVVQDHSLKCKPWSTENSLSEQKTVQTSQEMQLDSTDQTYKNLSKGDRFAAELECFRYSKASGDWKDYIQCVREAQVDED